MDPTLLADYSALLQTIDTMSNQTNPLDTKPRGPLKAKCSAQIAIILRRLKPFINV